MAWGDLTALLGVSFTNMQTSGIPLKAGQSHTTSNELMTKAGVIAKYSVNEAKATLAAKGSNDIVVKQDLEAAITYYSHWLSYDNGSNLGALCGGPTYEYFSDAAVLDIGERIYSNSALTTYPAAGYYSDGSTVWQANLVGLLAYEGACGVSPF